MYYRSSYPNGHGPYQESWYNYYRSPNRPYHAHWKGLKPGDNVYLSDDQWNRNAGCGNGLHANAAWGSADLCIWTGNAIWHVLEPIGEVVSIGKGKGKVKAKGWKVIAVGSHERLFAKYPTLIPAWPLKNTDFRLFLKSEWDALSRRDKTTVAKLLLKHTYGEYCQKEYIREVIDKKVHKILKGK